MAVMVPFLVVGMMGFLDLGRAFYYQISLTNAVREGARLAAEPQYFDLNGSCPTPPVTSPWNNCPVPTDQGICDRVVQELNGTGFTVACTDIQVQPDQTSRVYCWLGNPSCTQTPDSQYGVTVNATYNFHFITPIIGSLIGDPLTLHSSATMRTDY
jgi:hypothetical protein